MFQRTIPRGGYGGQSRSSGRNSRRKRRIPTESANWQLFPTPCDVAHTLHAYAYASLLRKFLDSRDNAVAPADPWHKTGSHVHRYTHICISETGNEQIDDTRVPSAREKLFLPLCFSLFRVEFVRGENNPCESSSCLEERQGKTGGRAGNETDAGGRTFVIHGDKIYGAAYGCVRVMPSHFSPRHFQSPSPVN